MTWAVVALLHAGCVSNGYIEPDLGPKDDTAAEDVEYSNYRISCTCDCKSEAKGLAYSALDINHLCLPAEWSGADYCTEVMCPAFALYHRNRVAESDKYECEDIDITCEPGAKNEDGETTTGGASRRKETTACDGDCADILCVESTAEYCTYSATNCPEPDSSPKFCRALDEASESGSSEQIAASRRDARADLGALPRPGVDEAAWPSALAAVWPGGARVTSTAACSPGHGEFALVPVHEYDRNGDGKWLTLSRPLQLEGTGRLTPDAWITHARVSWPGSGGEPLVYALRPGHRPQVLPGDLLGDLPSATVAIGDRLVEPQPGVLGGGGAFVQLAVQGALIPTVLDLGWECSYPGLAPRRVPLGSTDAVNRVTARDAVQPSGAIRPALPAATAEYSFTLDEVGCGVDWPQRFSLRPRLGARVTTFTVGLLGDWQDVRRGHRVLSEEGSAHDVSFDARGLRVLARVLGWDDAMAVVRVKRTTFRGREVCRPGVYYLRGER